VQSAMTHAFLTFVKVNMFAKNGTSNFKCQKMCAWEPCRNTLLYVYFTPTVH